MTDMAQRILIVEDDPGTIQVARAYLEREGFAVESASDGATGLAHALGTPPALIVLDWMLPGMDGPEFVRRLRRDRDTPVIMLTARSEEIDRIVGLELGADDYVTKPFSPRELVARVNAVLRRFHSEAPANDVTEHGALVVDPSQRRAEYAGCLVCLTTLEFDLLHAFVRAPGRVFTRDDLIDRVWGLDFEGVDRVVDVQVSNLRHKLSDAGGEALLETVRGVGYRLA